MGKEQTTHGLQEYENPKNYSLVRGPEKLNKLLKKKNNKLNNIFKISNYFKNTLLRTH